MKKIALAVLFALCGARVYGMEQQVAQPVTQADMQAVQEGLEAALKDTKSIEALSEMTGISKEEAKSWMSRNKVALISSIVSIAALYGTGAVLGHRYGNNKIALDSSDFGKWNNNATRFNKICYFLNYLNAPLTKAANGACHAGTWMKGHKAKTAVVALVAVLVGALIFDLSHGKDAQTIKLFKKIFGKNAETVQIASELAKEVAKEEEKKAAEVTKEAIKEVAKEEAVVATPTPTPVVA
jgi:hypothetical protein